MFITKFIAFPRLERSQVIIAELQIVLNFYIKNVEQLFTFFFCFLSNRDSPKNIPFHKKEISSKKTMVCILKRRSDYFIKNEKSNEKQRTQFRSTNKD